MESKKRSSVADRGAELSSSVHPDDQDEEQSTESRSKKSKGPDGDSQAIVAPTLQTTPNVGQQHSMMTVYVPSYSPPVMDRTCQLCKQLISMNEIPVMTMEYSVYHDQCFRNVNIPRMITQESTKKPPNTSLTTATTASSLPMDGPPSTARSTHDSQTVVAAVTKEPEHWQIAHYNIHPPPEVTIYAALANNERIYAVLVDSETSRPLPHALVKGNQHAYLSGTKTYIFSGLKLARLNVIQNDLEAEELPKKGGNFCIQFTVGNFTCKTTPFKIATTYQDLPVEEQKKRPYKKETKDPPP